MNVIVGPDKMLVPDTNHDLLEVYLEIEVPEDICIKAPDDKLGKLLV